MNDMILFHSQSVEVVSMLEGRCHSIILPCKIDLVHMMSRHEWIIQESETNAWVFFIRSIRVNWLWYIIMGISLMQIKRNK